jgi:hypothetical protein
MIIEICYDSDQGWLSTGEPLAKTREPSEDLEELSFEQSNNGFIHFSHCGSMYVIHAVREFGGSDHIVIFYIADNKHEATKAFVEELEFHLEEFSDNMTRKELENALKTSEKYKDYSRKFSRIKQMTEKLIAKKPPPPSPPSFPPPVSMMLETCKEQLKKDLNLPQGVLDRTRELIESYQPCVDEHIKGLIENYKAQIEEGKIEYVSPVLELPRYLKPEIIVGACLYLACNEKGVRVSQFQIAKTQGHYDTSALSITIGQVSTKLRLR